MLSSSKKGAPVIKEFGAIDVLTAHILKGASLSDEINIGGTKAFAILMPSNWTTAGITFQAASHAHVYNDLVTEDGNDLISEGALDFIALASGTFKDVYGDDGTEISITAAAGRAIVINNKKDALFSLPYIKIRSGTTGSPQAQGADRSFTIICKG